MLDTQARTDQEEQRNYELAERLISEQNFTAAVIVGAITALLAAAIYSIITARWGFSYGFVAAGIVTPLTLPDAWPTNIHRDPQNLSPGNSDTKLVVLGTGIWRSIARAALVNGDEFTRGLSPEKLKYLFVTHLHEDHTVGIPSLLLNPFKLDIPTSKEIYGPKGIEDMVRHIVAAWTIDIEEAVFDGYDPEGGRATGHEILFDKSGMVYQDDNVTVEAFRTKHGSLTDTFAYRFSTEERVIVFTGDGGPYHDNIVKAAMNADVY